MTETECEAREDRYEAYTDMSVFFMLIANFVGWGTYACWLTGGV